MLAPRQVRGRLAVVALLTLAVPGCGTTVDGPGTAPPTAQGLGAQGGAPSTDGTGPAGTGTRTGTGSGLPGAPVSGGTGGSASGASATGSTGTTGAQTPTGGAAVTARGLTPTEIRIGVVTTQDAATLGKSLGAENLVGGDHVAEIDALLKHINAQGGITGRKAVAVYQDVRTADATSDPNASAQSACNGLTEDKQVFAVISIVGNLNNDVMYQCMVKHRTPFFGVDLVPHHTRTFTKYAPYVYGAHTLALERLVPTLVSRLQAQAYFSGWDTTAGAPAAGQSKVGVLYADADPDYLQLTKSALARAGHAAVDSFGYKSDLSTLGSQMQSAVLQFRQHGVTHVLIEESDGVLFFLPAAENQNYRPRYGFTSLNGAKALADTQAIPARQFVGMRGVGWAPAIDVGNTKTESAAAASCRKVMTDAGLDATDSTAFFYMAVECDAFLLLREALARQQAFTAAGLRQGMEALGTQFAAAAVIGIAWHPGSYDGVSALRDFGYDGGAFSYTGPSHPT